MSDIFGEYDPAVVDGGFHTINQKGNVDMPRRKLLHLGCGQSQREHTPAYFQKAYWEHLRVDATDEHKPDLISFLPDLKELTDIRADAIYLSHTLEHLHPTHAAQALLRFHEILNPGGILVVIVPDILEAMKLGIKAGTTEAVAYNSPAGPITVHDMLYGFYEYTLDRPYMRHQCAFTPDLLKKSMLRAGFVNLTILTNIYDIEAWATKPLV